MAENKTQKLPNFDTTEEFVEFFDTHDMSEYWEQMPEAHFEVDVKDEKSSICIDNALMEKLLEISKLQHTSIEALLDIWLWERVVKEKLFHSKEN